MCVCVGVGTICTGGWGGARKAPGPTANYFPKEKLGTAIPLPQGPRDRHWPLSPNELGYPSELPPHPATGWGMREVVVGGGRQNSLEKCGVCKKTPA